MLKEGDDESSRKMNSDSEIIKSSSVVELQDKFNHAVSLKFQRRYDCALNFVSEILHESPLFLAGEEVWQYLFNAPSWFSLPGEDLLYFRYADNIMCLLQKTCSRLDTSDAVKLSSAFVLGSQFRHTTHNQENLKKFMSRRADLFKYSLKNFPVKSDYVFSSPVSRGGKIRIGILFKHLKNDPELTSLIPFFENVNSSEIEVYVYLHLALADKECAKYIDSICKEMVLLPENLGDAISYIRGQDLDIILFGNDITAKPSFFSYLSFFRLARRSACCVSTLATTGSPYIDLYFGSSYYEGRGFSEEFSEEFVSFPEPSFAFWFPSEENKKVVSSRDSFGLPESGVLLVSGANHTKLHTDLIEIWSKILKKVENSTLILYPFPPHFGPASEEVKKRIRGDFLSFGVGAERVVIMSGIFGRNNVIALLRLMDVGLDSFPYTGVTTIVDAVEAGLPTVTYAGDTLRSSQGAAILHSIGSDELIVNSKKKYVDLVVSLSENADMRMKIREKLRSSEKPFLDSESFSLSAIKNYHNLYESLRINK